MPSPRRQAARPGSFGGSDAAGSWSGAHATTSAPSRVSTTCWSASDQLGAVGDHHDGASLGEAGEQLVHQRGRPGVEVLEELPLHDLRAFVGVGRHVLGSVTEVPEDRVGLSKRPAVVEDERGHPQRRVEITEHGRAVGAIEDAQLPPLERDAELGQEQADLVTVAGDG